MNGSVWAMTAAVLWQLQVTLAMEIVHICIVSNQFPLQVEFAVSEDRLGWYIQ